MEFLRKELSAGQRDGWGSACELLMASQSSEFLLMRVRAEKFVNPTMSQPGSEHWWFGIYVDQGTHIKYWPHQFLHGRGSVGILNCK